MAGAGVEDVVVAAVVDGVVRAGTWSRRRNDGGMARSWNEGVYRSMRSFRRELICAFMGTALVMAGCGKSTPNRDLQHDLDLAGSEGGLSLTPAAAGTQVVSSVERTQDRSSAVAPSQAVQITRHVRSAPKIVATEHVSDSDVEAPVSAPQPQPQATPEATPQPAPQPVPQSMPRQREPPGGWKTEGEVFRHAPFPITP